MFKKSILAIMAIASCPTAFATGFSIHLQGGMSMTNYGTDQYLWLTDNVQNHYVTPTRTTSSGFVGFGFAYQWDQIFAHIPYLALNLGVSNYYLDNSFTGTNTPFVNAGDAYPLNYSMSDHSSAIMLESKFIDTAYAFQPYVIAGVGQAANTLKNYSETSTDPSGSSSGTPYPFQDKTYTNFAYEFGLGLQHVLFTRPNGGNLKLAADYRYMNWGKMGLSTYQGQSTNETLNFGQLKTQLISASLIAQF